MSPSLTATVKNLRLEILLLDAHIANLFLVLQLTNEVLIDPTWIRLSLFLRRHAGDMVGTSGWEMAATETAE